MIYPDTKNRLHFCALAFAVLIGLAGCKREPDAMEKFHGMWQLDRHELRDSISNNWVLDSTRIGLTGFVIYDGNGHMGVRQIMAPDISSENNIDITYFGTCMILPGDVIQHTKLSSTFDDIGVSVRRGFEFRDDTLLLTPEEAEGRIRIRWIKVKN